jgi:hypothetical protein
MEHLAKIIGYSTKGEDGVLGVLSDIYLEQASWRVKYFAIEHGESIDCLEGEEVGTLISPASVMGADLQKKTLSVSLSKKQLKSIVNSPKDESELQESSETWFNYLIGTRLFRFFRTNHISKDVYEGLNETLQSVNDLLGYSVTLADGEKGELRDLLVSHRDAPWRVDHVVVALRPFVGAEKRVLIKPEQISSIRNESGEEVPLAS